MPNNKSLLFAILIIVVFLLSGCANRATVDMHKSFNIDSIKSLHIKNSDGGSES